MFITTIHRVAEIGGALWKALNGWIIEVSRGTYLHGRWRLVHLVIGYPNRVEGVVGEFAVVGAAVNFHGRNRGVSLEKQWLQSVGLQNQE